MRYLIPWSGVFFVLCFDVYSVVQTILDWPRLIIKGAPRKVDDATKSYLVLRYSIVVVFFQLFNLMIGFSFAIKFCQDDNSRCIWRLYTYTVKRTV